MILKIRKDIDPILREPTQTVTDFGHEFQLFIDNMVETMNKSNGIGLAAPQVGSLKKVFICGFEGDKEVDFPSFPLTIIANPEIAFESKENKKMVEGCLSFPGLELLIKRPENIVVKGQDRFGNNTEIKADKLYSRVIQHEFDHLNSTLMIDRLEQIRTVFIGTGTMGAKALKLMARDPQYEIVYVITTDEKEIIGRKSHAVINPIKEIAQKHKLNIIQTKKIRTDLDLIEKLKKAKLDLGVIADFGQIVPKEIINIPTHGILNIHPSLLPKYRGPSPIQATILNGDTIAGVTIMTINEKMDAGGIVSQAKVKLSPSDTTTTLKNYLSEIAASLLLNTIPYYMAGDLPPVEQDETAVTYTKMVQKEDGAVDKNTDKSTVDKKIRAYDEWPKAFIVLNKKRVQLLAGHFEESGEFVIDRVKPEGKKEMGYQDFLRGYKAKLTFE